MTTYTVTATTAGTRAFNGIGLQVLVLTNATESGGGSASGTGTAGADHVGLTPNFNNSLIVLGAQDAINANALTAQPSNSFYTAAGPPATGGTSVANSGIEIGFGQYTSTVAAGIAVTVGATGTSGDALGVAGYEVPAINPASGITHVNSQTIHASSSSASAYTATVPAGTGIAAGDLIVVNCVGNGTHVSNGMAVKDSVNGVNYTTLLETDETNSSSYFQDTKYYQTPVAIADGSTFTFTPFASSSNNAFAVDIFRGCSGAIDKSVVGPTNSSPSTTLTGPALGSNASAGSLVVSFAAGTSATTLSLNAGAFTQGSVDTSVRVVGNAYVLNASGSSTYATNWSQGSSGSWATQVVSFAAGTPPAIDGSSPAAVESSTLTANVSVTPPVGSVLVAIAVGNGGGSAGGTLTSTVSDGLLTWTQRVFQITGTNSGYIAIWTATVGSGVAPASTVPGVVANPGQAWENVFGTISHNHKESVLYDVRSQFAGSYLTAGDLAFGATTSGSQLFIVADPAAILPSPAWSNQFQPYLPKKQAVLFDVQPPQHAGVYLTAGDLAFGAVTAGIANLDIPGRSYSVAGPPFRNQFQQSSLTKQAVRYDYHDQRTGSTTLNIAFGANTTGNASIPGTISAQPAIPGPALRNRIPIFAAFNKEAVLHSQLDSLGPFGPFCFTAAEFDTNLYGGTETDTNLNGGTATETNLYGGAVSLGCAPQVINLTLREFNDETINLTIQSNGVPFNLTGYGLQALFKVAPGIPDTDPSTLILSVLAGGITITSAAAGTAVLTIPSADLQGTQFGFWRVDLLYSGNNQATAIYGSVSIRTL